MLSWHAMIHGVYGQVQLQLENMCYLSSAAEPVVPSFPSENRWSGVVRKLGIPKNLVVKSFTPSLSSRRCLQVFISCFYLTSCYKKKLQLWEKPVPSHHQPSPAITSHHQPSPAMTAAWCFSSKSSSSSSRSKDLLIKLCVCRCSSCVELRLGPGFSSTLKNASGRLEKQTDGIWWRSGMRMDESQSMWWNVGDNRQLACSKLHVTILIYAGLQVVSLKMSK